MKLLQSRILREAAVLLLLIFMLLIADAICYQITLPVEIDEQDGIVTLHVDSQILSLGQVAPPTALQFAPRDPVVHEYQLDGTDSTNNFTLDATYLNSIASSPYYRFQAWMRDLDGTSHWRGLQIWANGRLIRDVAWPSNGSQVSLSSQLPTASLRIRILLQRPETPMTLNLITADGAILHIMLDRNDRYIQVTRSVPGKGDNLPATSTFFPVTSAPFAAMVIDFLVRVMLWAVLVLLVVVVAEVAIAWVARKASSVTRRGGSGDEVGRGPLGRPRRPRSYGLCESLTKALHPSAFMALGISFLFVAWIARVQYNAEPHIYDANAYLFAAKMYALGHLSVPIPPAIDRFPGPFMVQSHGQWFAQYAPGTGLTLVPGLWLGVPWLVEPILGTFALLGIGLVAARLYDRRVATLAVLLGTLSPFYSYLAASYFSHAVALFYLVWGLWALVRFAQGEASWNMPLSAALFGMAGLTRDLVAVLFLAIVLPGVLALSWQRRRKDWARWLLPGIAFIMVVLVFVVGSLDFNAFLTGSPWVSPRSLFFAGDHWGFGPDVGFYGQHTLAAGFVNLDELLTILAIDLFGWPFYLTLAFLAMPFLTRRAVGVDWLLLIGATLLTAAYIGYFYHGIYLGPRYLFEALPFLLILTARGILTLAATSLHVTQAVNKKLNAVAGTTITTMRRPSVSIATVLLVAALIVCNLVYFMPRQIELHKDYTGLPAGYHIDVSSVYHPSLHNALIVTSDYTIYQLVLFPLNDPLLHNDVIYAYGNTAPDYTELHKAFPGRTVYRMDIGPDGSVQYVVLTEDVAAITECTKGQQDQRICQQACYCQRQPPERCAPGGGNWIPSSNL